MFDIGWSEIMVIAVVAIVVVGPKDLPPMLRAFGRTIAKMRKMAGEFQGQFNEALKEAELDDVKKSFDELRGLNPLNDIRRSLDPMAGPIAKPAPPPVPPSATQLAQPETAADIDPAPSLEQSLTPAQIAALPEAVADKPKRVRKPRVAKIADEIAATEPEIAAAEPKKPRVRKPKAEAAPIVPVTSEPLAPLPAETAPATTSTPPDEATP